jgi:hypothetical protein
MPVLGERAIVLGASMGGLLATRLLHPSFLYRVAAVNLLGKQRPSQSGQAAVDRADGSALPEMSLE